MTNRERDLIRQALHLLQRLAEDEPHAVDQVRHDCPVALFARRFLLRDPVGDVTSEELWTFFGEVVASGELEPLSKTEFLSRLPGVMESSFGVRKSHNIRRGGQRVRGFRGVGLRMEEPPSIFTWEA
jgi:hypothetical protein